MISSWASQCPSSLPPGEPIPPGPLQPTEPTAVDGSFKTPGLRNIELTGPYMHNGGMATLRQVVDFYNRGGDFAAQNQANLDPDIVPLGLTNEQENALVAFLLGLTDPRVKWEKAPFDHPSLCVPNGELGNQTVVIEGIANPGQAQDGPMLCLPAVGARGASAPLQPFLGLNPFQTLPAISITGKLADPTNNPTPTFTFTVAAAGNVSAPSAAAATTLTPPATATPTTLPAATATPRSTATKTARPDPRREQPLVTVSVPRGIGSHGAPVMVQVRTRPGADARITLQLTRQGTRCTGAARQRVCKSMTTVLAERVVHVRANRQGQVTRSVALGYSPTSPLRATLGVRVSTRYGAVTHTAAVRLQPAPRARQR